MGRPRKQYDPTQTSKTCTKCKKELPLSCFAKNNGTVDGLQYWCRDCVYVYNKVRKSRLEAERLVPRQEMLDDVQFMNLVAEQRRLAQEAALGETSGPGGSGVPLSDME